MTCEQAQALVKARLSHKRYKHTLNVKNKAVALAERYGADPEKAALAALLHDAAKELPRDAMLQIFRDNAIMAKNAASRPSPVWHGIAAAILCATDWGVTDPAILSAIECHTTGKANMSLLDKILYMADYIEPNRDFEGVDRLRRLAYEDLDKALLLGVETTIQEMQERRQPIHQKTIEACQWLRGHGVTTEKGIYE